MKRLPFLLAALAALGGSLALASPAAASFIVGRNPSHPILQVDATGHALISFSAQGKEQHVLVWGAVNASPPTRGANQVAFKVDFSGGFAIHKSSYYKTIKNVCRPYTGPALPFYVTGCDAPDGSYWALQLWQRMLPDLGFKPWQPQQAVEELEVSHWSGPLPTLTVYQDWAWGGRYEQIFGTFNYAGKAVYGFTQTASGVPLDSWGRNLYLDTENSAYGSGWRRENSFLAEPVNGEFCYSFGPRPPYSGYPDSPPRDGTGTAYRITVLGPGVMPAIQWEGPAVGVWSATDPTDISTEQKANAVKQTLGFQPSKCNGA